MSDHWPSIALYDHMQTQGNSATKKSQVYTEIERFKQGETAEGGMMQPTQYARGLLRPKMG